MRCPACRNARVQHTRARNDTSGNRAPDFSNQARRLRTRDICAHSELLHSTALTSCEYIEREQIRTVFLCDNQGGSVWRIIPELRNGRVSVNLISSAELKKRMTAAGSTRYDATYLYRARARLLARDAEYAQHSDAAMQHQGSLSNPLPLRRTYVSHVMTSG
jgi:hypothetical protein